MPLEQYRMEIDKIDSELTSLFFRRMDIVCEVARHKLENEITVLQPERETALLKKLTHNLDTLQREEVLTLYQTIFTISRNRQEKIIEEHKKATD